MFHQLLQRRGRVHDRRRSILRYGCGSDPQRLRRAKGFASCGRRASFRGYQILNLFLLDRVRFDIINQSNLNKLVNPHISINGVLPSFTVNRFLQSETGFFTHGVSLEQRVFRYYRQTVVTARFNKVVSRGIYRSTMSNQEQTTQNLDGYYYQDCGQFYEYEDDASQCCTAYRAREDAKADECY